MSVNSFYSEEELSSLGLKQYGKKTLISRNCSIYSPETITIGDNVRIDDFCILSGKIQIGSNVHISAFCALYGSMGIEIQDYSGMSPKSIIYSASDDFSGNYLIGAVNPKELTNVTGGKVTLCKYTQLGTNTIVFPSVTINEGAVTGAMSLVLHDLKPWTINTGIPISSTRKRSNKLLTLLQDGNYNVKNC